MTPKSRVIGLCILLLPLLFVGLYKGFSSDPDVNDVIDNMQECKDALFVQQGDILTACSRVEIPEVTPKPIKIYCLRCNDFTRHVWRKEETSRDGKWVTVIAGYFCTECRSYNHTPTPTVTNTPSPTCTPCGSALPLLSGYASSVVTSDNTMFESNYHTCTPTNTVTPTLCPNTLATVIAPVGKSIFIHTVID